MQVQNVCCRSQIVNNKLNRRGIIWNGRDRNSLCTALALGLKQGRLWLRPWHRLSEHVILISGAIGTLAWLIARTFNANVYYISNIWFLWFRRHVEWFDNSTPC